MSRIVLRRILAFLPLLVLATATMSQDPMPGFRNPTSFVSAGSSANFVGWSARVGDRISSGASTGSSIKSTCAFSNCNDIVGHANITASSLNSGPDQGITCCNHTSLWDAAQDHRFMIITSANAGLDQMTVGSGGGMQRIPTGYNSSIRLGDPRATRDGAVYNATSWSASNPNKSSEALFYTMNVTPQNALLFINYAVVARCYDHTPDVAGEFTIRVVKQNSNGTWPNAPINDSMWFRISAPAIPSNNIPEAPWMMGRPCSNENTQGCYCAASTCAYVYKPWAKVAISLNAFLYDKVRIELYTSDCVPTVDPIYAYITGDYQAMVLSPSGCPDPESSVVDTIVAPEGMLSYAWFVATNGAVPDQQTLNAAYMDTVSFRQVWPIGGGTTTDNTYAVQYSDFLLTEGAHAGDTVAKQTFKCVMTSALDPSKPFESRVYQNFTNRRPFVGYGYEAHCDTSVTFTDGSTVLVADGLNEDSTHWVFYADTLGLVPMDTVYGLVVNYHFPAPGHYGVKIFSTTDGVPCTAAKFFVCEAIGLPPADFTVSDHELCESTPLVMSASNAVRQLAGATLQWAIDDSVVANSSFEPHVMVPLGKHVVSLTVISADSCSFTTYDTVTVFGQPSINLSSTVAAICEGDSVTLSAAGSISYSWNAAPYDPTLDSAQGLNSFTVHPTVSTTYYLLPSEDNPCSVEGAEVYIEVIPYPIPTIRTSSPRVNKENSTLVIYDESPYAAASHWSFSDGGTAEGQRVTHAFTDLSADSVSITLNTCNRLNCCADTSIQLPVQVTTVWFPNTFTPDESTNNLFGVHTSLTFITYEMSIYNRQGMLVYYSDDQNAPWNGTLDGGADAPQGTYVWICRYSYGPDATFSESGSVTLIR